MQATGCTGRNARGNMSQLSERDKKFLALAVGEAREGMAVGGVPIGSVLTRGDAIVGAGHNQRIQKSDPILHGEMAALQNAGRQRTYKDTVIYTTLSPCMMCAGTIIQFGIPRVVIGENKTFGGNEDFLRSRGVEVLVADDPDCFAMMKEFIAANPHIWNEDIMVD